MPEPIVISIARQPFDAALGMAGSIETFANDDSGHDAFVGKPAGMALDPIVMEAASGLEREPACARQAAGFAVAVVNPRKAQDFAKAMGYLPDRHQGARRTGSGAGPPPGAGSLCQRPAHARAAGDAGLPAVTRRDAPHRSGKSRNDSLHLA
jgi:hypothetical protein